VCLTVLSVILEILSAVYQSNDGFPWMMPLALAVSVPMNAPAIDCWRVLQGFNMVFLLAMAMMAYQAQAKITGEYTRLTGVNADGEVPLEPLVQESPEEGLDEGKPRRLWSSTSFWGNLSFQWVNDIVKEGSVRTLEIEDCVVLDGPDSSAETEKRLSKTWEAEKVAAEKSGRKASILRAFVRAYFVEFFLLGGSLRFVRTIFNILMGAYFLPMLLGTIRNRGPTTNYLDAFLIAILICATNLSQLVVNHQFGVLCVRTGLRMRSSYMTTVFSKVLKLRNSHLPIGEIVNMVSTDSSKFYGQFFFLSFSFFSSVFKKQNKTTPCSI